MSRIRLTWACAALLLVSAAVYVGCNSLNESQPAAPSEKAAPADRIATTTTFNHCVGGWVSQETSVACDECDHENFTSSTSGPVEIWLYHPLTCDSFLNGILEFNTSGLDDNSTISSATLKFSVKDYEPYNLYQQMIRVLVGNTDPCDSSFDGKQFWGCTQDLVDLGTVAIDSTGNYQFTIANPNSVISKNHVTEFYFVDASIPALEATVWYSHVWLRQIAATARYQAPSLVVVN